MKRACISHTPSLSSVFPFIIVLLVAFLAIPACKEGPVGPEGPPGDDNLSNPSVLPVVVFSYPLNNTTGPFEIYSPGSSMLPHFVVRLNKLMAISSLGDSSVTIRGFDRPVRPIIYREYYYWDRAPAASSFLYDDVLAFRVYETGQYYGFARYEVGKRYTVSIKGPMVDINGNPFLTPYEFSFVPEPRFRVVAFVPDTTRPVNSSLTAIEIVFNSEIDHRILGHVSITPAPPPGDWTLPGYNEDTTSLLYRSFENFAFNTSYVVTLDSSAHDVEGHSLGLPRTVRFTTLPFSVTQVYPSDGSTGVGLTGSITINANGAIDSSTIRSSLEFDPPTPGQISAYASASSFSFVPTDGFLPSTHYTVQVGTTLRSASGDSLVEPYSFSFTTEEMKIITAYPSDYSTQVSRQASIGMSSNTALDTSTIWRSFSIEPPVPGRITFSSSSVRSYEFVPSSPLAANTIYRITVTQALRSANGTYLPRTYNSSFKTGPN